MEFHRKAAVSFIWTPHPSMPDHDAVVAHLNFVAQLVHNLWDNEPKVTSSTLRAKIWISGGRYQFYPKVVCQGDGLIAADLDNNIAAALGVLKDQLDRPGFSSQNYHVHLSTGSVNDPPVKGG